MAFIFSIFHFASVQPSATASTPRCNLERIRAAVAPAAAAMMLSAAMLSPAHVSAQDAPLIFDHDQSLSGADFSNRKDLRASIFSKSNCKQANFAGADLTNAQLDDANVGIQNTCSITHGPVFQGAACLFEFSNPVVRIIWMPHLHNFS